MFLLVEIPILASPIAYLTVGFFIPVVFGSRVSRAEKMGQVGARPRAGHVGTATKLAQQRGTVSGCQVIF